MKDFSECFLTGTAAEVTPVSQVGSYSFTPGPVCEAMMDDYANEVREMVKHDPI
jgi:branched-chain amino acid aminotransferase